VGPGARTARRGGDEGVAAGRGPTVAAVAGAGAVNAVCLLPLFLTAALAVQLRAELGFGPAALGVAVATFLGAAAAASVPLGRLAQRVGPGRGLRVAAAVSAVCTLGITDRGQPGDAPPVAGARGDGAVAGRVLGQPVAG
jgi:hypothetical protein